MGNNEFEKLVIEAVRCYANEHRFEYEKPLSDEDVYIVWSCKTLQNNKALASTTSSDGMYYELTYNGDKDELYLDAYRKLENRCIKSPIERVMLLGGGVSAVATVDSRSEELSLRDTVPLMLSADYKERFEAEYLQLKIRHGKLAAMITKYENGTLDFKPTCPIELLIEQRDCMQDYLDILAERANLEGVELN